MTGLEQIGIGVFGVAAIWLSQDSRERVRRWSCIAGMCAQPFWFYTTAINGQWGIFALSFFYTWSWWKGVRTYWLVKHSPLSALEEMRQRKDAAYEERNKVVAALARLYPSGIARTAIEGWSEDWHGCVYIDLPAGQVSWHFHDSQAHLFDGLPAYTKPWDGHDTPEKYRRVAALGCTALSTDASLMVAAADRFDALQMQFHGSANDSYRPHLVLGAALLRAVARHSHNASR